MAEGDSGPVPASDPTHTGGDGSGRRCETELEKIMSWLLRRRAGARNRASIAESSFDKDHRAAASWALPHGASGRSGGRCGEKGCGRSSQQLEDQRKRIRTTPVGEESEVPDAHESPGQHVQKEPPQELVQRQPHQPLLVMTRRVAPAEGNATLSEISDGWRWPHGACSSPDSGARARRRRMVAWNTPPIRSGTRSGAWRRRSRSRGASLPWKSSCARAWSAADRPQTCRETRGRAPSRAGRSCSRRNPLSTVER